METPERPRWIAPFRLLAFAFGLISAAALILHLRSPSWGWPLAGLGAMVIVALFCFALVPPSFLARYWMAPAVLACAGLGFVLNQLRELAGRGVDPLLLSGHGLMAAVFIAMLVEAVQFRRRKKGASARLPPVNSA